MEHINDILAKHFSKTGLTAEEEIILSEWIANHEDEYVKIQKSWDSLPEFDYKEFDSKNAWLNIETKIEDDSNQTKIFNLKSIIKYAAIASLAVLLSIGGFKFFSETNNYIVFENNSNTTKSIILEDGSTIYLAKNTVIEYHENFTNNRYLKLEGEAFFDVNRDEHHPFIISTAYGEIEVLGTSFNINTFNKTTHVSVTSGLVELRNNDSSIKLNKNESATSNGSTITDIVTNNLNYLSWKTGDFIFNHTILTEAINVLNKHFTVKVVLDKNIDNTCKITGTFENQKIEDIIEAITLSCNLESTRENNQITIK